MRSGIVLLEIGKILKGPERREQMTFHNFVDVSLVSQITFNKNIAYLTLAKHNKTYHWRLYSILHSKTHLLHHFAGGRCWDVKEDTNWRSKKSLPFSINYWLTTVRKMTRAKASCLPEPPTRYDLLQITISVLRVWFIQLVILINGVVIVLSQ